MQQGQKELIFIKNDFKSKEEAIEALNECESRFQALISNTPGLFFQFQLNNRNEIHFTYISDGCKKLLGHGSEALNKDDQLFFSIINNRDLLSLHKKIKLSANNLKPLIWNGRISSNSTQDYRWINLRSTPRTLSNGTIQWEGIMTDITELKNEKSGVLRSRRSLAKLSAHMNQIKEHERSRIAREIHDDLGGNLTAIKIGLSSIISHLNLDQKDLLAKTKSLESIVDNTFDAVHRISSDLRPNILDLGIVAALEWQSHEFEKQLGIKCQFTHQVSKIPVTTDQSITLFRICQEAMSNIAKHAKASSVQLDLRVNVDEIVMTIGDNGVGIKPSDTLKVNSFGLRGMQERVIALRGSFDVTEYNDTGTVISIKLPIERENDFF
jgi:signal transduction histidine kinase